MFIGWATTLLWLPNFSDHYGRKKYFWLGQIIDLIMFTGVMLTTNYIVMMVLFFLFGAIATLRM